MNKVARRPRLSLMNGIRYPEMFSPKCFKEAFEYIPMSEDVIISTYPKCGSTWMMNIVLNILQKGKELERPADFWNMSCFIDSVGLEGVEKMSRPGAIKTHLPYSHRYYSPKAKYIYVARNPKDCCVSYYYHMRDEIGYGYWGAEFNEFFELFLSGEIDYNDYFDHILDWYPHRNDQNVFYTTYEEMKKDIKSIILKLSKFLGSEYMEAIEKDNAILNNIVLHSGMDYMKNLFEKINKWANLNINDDRMLAGRRFMYKFRNSLNPPDERPKREFIRKGMIGDWKNHLTPEENERLNQKFLEKLKGTEIMHWFPLE